MFLAGYFLAGMSREELAEGKNYFKLISRGAILAVGVTAIYHYNKFISVIAGLFLLGLSLFNYRYKEVLGGVFIGLSSIQPALLAFNSTLMILFCLAETSLNYEEEKRFYADFLKNSGLITGAVLTFFTIEVLKKV